MAADGDMNQVADDRRLRPHVAELRLTNRDGIAYEAVALVDAPSPPAAKTRLRDWLEGRDMLLDRAEFAPLPDRKWDLAVAGAQSRGDAPVWLGPLGFADSRRMDGPPVPQGPFRQRRLADIRGWPGRQIEDGETAAPAPIQPLLFPADRAKPASEGAVDHAYAIVDGNRMFGLAQRLETSGLRHRCLYKGAAAKDYGDSAPWLVELLPDHPLTRLLFTDDPRKGGARLWPDQAASFLVSPLGIDAMQAHLRRFTMIIDPDRNKRFYFRFYAPEILRSVIAGMPDDRMQALGAGVRRFLCTDGEGGALVLERAG